MLPLNAIVLLSSCQPCRVIHQANSSIGRSDGQHVQRAGILSTSLRAVDLGYHGYGSMGNGKCSYWSQWSDRQPPIQKNKDISNFLQNLNASFFIFQKYNISARNKTTDIFQCNFVVGLIVSCKGRFLITLSASDNLRRKSAKKQKYITYILPIVPLFQVLLKCQ